MSRLVILMYHIVAEPQSAQEHKYCCTPAHFEAQMRHLTEAGHRVLSLGEVADAMDGRCPWPDRGVVVTFDDGFAETYANALPILTRYGIPATVFALSDRVGASNDWMSCRGFPARRLMSVTELRAMLTAGVMIGSHTCTHPHLPVIGAEAKRREIGASKARLEEMLGTEVTAFAYPYGQFDDEARRYVEEAGYRVACCTRSGFNGPEVDRYLLRRIEIFGGDSLWRFRQKLKFGANEVSGLYPLRYYASRVSARLRF